MIDGCRHSLADSLHRLNLDANGDSLEGTDFEADEDMPTPTVTSGGLRSDGEFRPARMRPADHRLLEDLRHAQEQPLPFAQATSLRAALRIPPDSRSGLSCYVYSYKHTFLAYGHSKSQAHSL